MTLPAEVTRHHTAWVHCAGCEPHPVRYAVDGDRMICFGDQLPADAIDGRSVFVTVHEIAGGAAVAQLNGTVHDVVAVDVDPNAILDLLEHVSLGRTAAEVDTAITRHRERRLVSFASQIGGTP
jgi:hypothetical protein